MLGMRSAELGLLAHQFVAIAGQELDVGGPSVDIHLDRQQHGSLVLGFAGLFRILGLNLMQQLRRDHAAAYTEDAAAYATTFTRAESTAFAGADAAAGARTDAAAR